MVWLVSLEIITVLLHWSSIASTSNGKVCRTIQAETLVDSIYIHVQVEKVNGTRAFFAQSFPLLVSLLAQTIEYYITYSTGEKSAEEDFFSPAGFMIAIRIDLD